MENTIFCSKCSKEHHRFRDKEHQKPAAYCNDCHARFMRETRPKHADLSDERRRKANSRSFANVYQNRGKLTKKPCSVCGDINSEKHHQDYDSPLEVTWLCRLHHIKLHGKKLFHDQHSANA